MARRRRRRFYARDRRGRFARTHGARGQYKRRMSTRKKVVIAGGAVVAAGAVAYGGRELYRAGARKGWDLGKHQGRHEATPARIRRGGKFTKETVNHDFSQNPFARGYKPAGRHGRAVRKPKVTAASLGRLYRRYERAAEGQGPRRASRNIARQTVSRQARRAASAAAARAKRYNAAQSASQGAARVRGAGRAAASGVQTARLHGMYAGDAVRRRAARGVATVAVARHLRTTKPSASARPATPFGPRPSAYSTQAGQKVSVPLTGPSRKIATRRRHAKSRRKKR